MVLTSSHLLLRLVAMLVEAQDRQHADLADWGTHLWSVMITLQNCHHSFQSGCPRLALFMFCGDACKCK